MGIRGTLRLGGVLRLVGVARRLVRVARRLVLVVRRFFSLRPFAEDTGAAVAEYAITTLAAIGFAGVLLRLLTGANAANVLEQLILGALRKFL